MRKKLTTPKKKAISLRLDLDTYNWLQFNVNNKSFFINSAARKLRKICERNPAVLRDFL